MATRATAVMRTKAANRPPGASSSRPAVCRRSGQRGCGRRRRASCGPGSPARRTTGRPPSRRRSSRPRGRHARRPRHRRRGPAPRDPRWWPPSPCEPGVERNHARRCAPTISMCSARETDHTRRSDGFASGTRPRIVPATSSHPARATPSAISRSGRRGAGVGCGGGDRIACAGRLVPDDPRRRAMAMPDDQQQEAVERVQGRERRAGRAQRHEHRLERELHQEEQRSARRSAAARGPASASTSIASVNQPSR